MNESFNIRNSGAGIGDQVCGAYVCSGILDQLPDVEINYFCKHSQWLSDIKGVNIKPYSEYAFQKAPSIDLYHDSSFSSYRSRMPKSRKEIYAERVALEGLQPVPPEMSRKHSGVGKEVILAPFSAWSNREWPIRKWLELEQKLIARGVEIRVIGLSDRKREISSFVSPSYLDLSPKKVVELLLSAGCVVTNDSGMAHMAGLYDIPVVAVISQEFGKYHLFSETSNEVVSGKRLRDISPSRVLLKVVQRLNGDSNRKMVIRAGEFGESSNGGIYNSSIFKVGEKLQMICRVEAENELVRHSESSAVPYLVTLDRNLKSTEFMRLRFKGSQVKARVEDFRVFAYKGSTYCSHPLVESHCTRQVISKLNRKTNELVLTEIPCLPSQKKVEKNWVFFEDRGGLYVLYSPAPYRLFKRTDLGYKKLQEKSVSVPWAKSSMVSNSTNPVAVSDASYLVFIHARTEDGVYRQGGMLIDRKTLLPTHVTENEILYSETASGIRRRVIYFMGAIKDGDYIIVSMGEGDYHTSVVRLPIDRILNQMVPV